jgi:D-alanine-D-alanine ligase
MLGIPYTGSRVLANAISLDKGMTKRLWRDAGLPVGPFQVLERKDEGLDPRLTFPLFVKPVREGTGMGINRDSVVHSETELRHRVRWVMETYRQPALVEDYLAGREFTVGLIGNGRGWTEECQRDFYEDRDDYHVFPVLEIDTGVGAGEGVYNAASKACNPGEGGAPLYLCPADIPTSLETELKQLAIRGFEAIGALDVGRVDFRLGSDGRPVMLEINTLPGLNPTLSDLCIMAQAGGLQYDDLINEILNLAVERYARERGGATGAVDLPRAVVWGATAVRGGL